MLEVDDTSKGNIVLVYMHCDPTFLVSVGDHVAAGQPIARVGPHYVNRGGVSVRNGNSGGVHLHFEVRVDGVQIDPLEFVTQDDDTTVLKEL